VRAAVVVPIKDFRRAKQRLSSVLTPHERVELARRMATHVITTAAPHDVYVVCDDHEVATFAEGLGAEVLWRPNLGLNGAIEAGVQHIAATADRVLIAHSDLPLARSFASLLDADDVAIVADRHGRGTNAIALPTGTAFTFRFGPGSFAAHRREAARHDLAVTRLQDDGLSWDVDTPDDLAHPDLATFLAWLPKRHSTTD
jgi:2-phospho-L-lactate/phosphoenolpyruvate guanylyltransferase